MQVILFCLLLLSLVACGGQPLALDTASTNDQARSVAEQKASVRAQPNEPWVTEYVINSDEINESSGLARSNLAPDLLWTHNDSGGTTSLYAMTTEGALVASVQLSGLGIINLDWEDMTSFTHEDKAYLLVGDIGDNLAFRSTLTLYLLEEPRIDRNALGPQREVAEVIASYTVRLPDAPRDIESLAVDASTQTAYLISKRDPEPVLYSVSLARTSPLEPQVTVVAANLGKINIPRAPASFPDNPERFNWVTSMDISGNGLAAYVGTLSHGYRYVRQPQQTWQQAFSQPPAAIDLPAFRQIEAGAFANGRDDAVFVTSENLPGRLARLRFPTAP